MIEQLRLVPTLWKQFPDVDEVQPINDRDYAVLNEIRDVLKRHDALSRFGVSLIHRHFDLHDGEVVVESTDRENRRQLLEVKDAAEVLDGGRILETQWVFDGSSSTMICVGFCHYDRGHKHYHDKK